MVYVCGRLYIDYGKAKFNFYQTIRDLNKSRVLKIR